LTPASRTSILPDWTVRLETVFAEGVDQALIDTMKKTEDRGRRALFIEILDRRRTPSAVPALLQEVASDAGNVRRRAISALGNVAGPEDVARLIHGLLKIQDAGERDEAGRAVAAVCARIADDARQADPVLDAYHKAAPAEQLVLLPVLGRIGGTKALGLVREAVADPDPKRRDSGRQALFNWPDSTVADDLASLAETASDRDLKNRAIHALARVVILPGDRTDDARLALLARTMKQANRNEDRRMILDRVREVHTFPAVRFAAGFLGEPKLASQACASIADLLHREEIRNPNQAEANKILDQVVATSKDKSLVERVKSFKSAKQPPGQNRRYLPAGSGREGNPSRLDPVHDRRLIFNPLFLSSRPDQPGGDVDIERGDLARGQLGQGDAGHGRVVGAEGQGRNEQIDASFPGHRRDPLTEAGVRGHAPAHAQPFQSCFL
jgi:HEAT repeats